MSKKVYSLRPRIVVHVFSEDGTRKIGECTVMLSEGEYKVTLGDRLRFPKFELDVNDIIEKTMPKEIKR